MIDRIYRGRREPQQQTLCARGLNLIRRLTIIGGILNEHCQPPSGLLPYHHHPHARLPRSLHATLFTMPTLVTRPPLPSPSAESTIAIAGRLYSASQVHTFIRGAAILTIFFFFSYLALVVFPKFAARGYPLAPAIAASHRQPAPIPERPFSPRPIASKASTGERSAVSPPQQQQYECNRPPSPIPVSSPPPYPYTPVVWTAVTHIHRIADTVIGAAPASMPLAARRIPSHAGPQTAPHQVQLVFPWVPATHDFGLVRRRIPPSAYRTTTFPRPPSAVLLEGLARKLNLQYVDGSGKSGVVKTRTKSLVSVSVRRRPFSAVFYGAQGNNFTVDGRKNAKGGNGKDKTADNASVGRGWKRSATRKENSQVPIRMADSSGN
ncbi:hypothetical protein B0H16DRAFT_649938 [Mycena metata]|uniref:Uncharacterized protein n=1 Tax=Mycena metata TaxID=1033252 RepID=A0AAD7J6N1_9AGAR|nr:hypothetical protein B0H16DRAFT_649938 [Mycena metata]